MNWNSNVDLGDILTVVTFIGVLIKFHVSNIERITRVETKLEMILYNQKNGKQ